MIGYSISRKEREAQRKEREEALAKANAAQRWSAKYYGAEAIDIKTLLKLAAGQEVNVSIVNNTKPYDEPGYYAFLYTRPHDGDYNLWVTQNRLGEKKKGEHSIMAISGGLSAEHIDKLFALWDQAAQMRGLKPYSEADEPPEEPEEEEPRQPPAPPSPQAQPV